MRLFQAPPTLLYTIVIILTSSQHSTATPYPRELDVDAADLQNNTLVARCDNPCGWSGQLCCPAGQTCYTDANNQAQCGAGGAATAQAQGGGYWQYYTTTYVETGYVTKTAIYSSYISAVVTVQQTYVNPPQTTAAAGTCNYALNESPCGSICCRSGQYCYTAGQCVAAGGGSSEIYASGFTTPSLSAPLRPTSGTLVVVTATASPTTTVPFETPVATGANITLTSSQASGGGLSGGAIAGIVIGVILAIILLILLCLFLCLRAGWDVLTGLFGGGKKKGGGGRRTTTQTEYIEEYHHHSGGGGAAAGGGRRWYGDRPARPQRPPPPKKGGGLGGAAGVAAGLAALWAVLGLKRRRDRRQEAKTEYTGSTVSSGYYDYSTTSPSSESSDDRRTRRSSRR